MVENMYVSNEGNKLNLRAKPGSDNSYILDVKLMDNRLGTRLISLDLEPDDVKRLYLSIDQLIRQGVL